MNLIRGSYITRRDNGVRYTYESTWMELSHGVLWDARVFLGGELAGTLNGRFHAARGVPSPAVVTRVVEASIELQTGVT